MHWKGLSKGSCLGRPRTHLLLYSKELLNRDIRIEILPHVPLLLILNTLFYTDAAVFELLCTSGGDIIGCVLLAYKSTALPSHSGSPGPSGSLAAYKHPRWTIIGIAIKLSTTALLLLLFFEFNLPSAHTGNGAHPSGHYRPILLGCDLVG